MATIFASSILNCIWNAAPAFAESGAELLHKYGFVKGGVNGDLMLDRKLTREQLAILVCELYGKSVEASRFKRPPNYRDAYQFPAWSKNYISYAQYMGWMQGMGDRKFSNKGYVPDTQLAIALTKVLGYAPKDHIEALSILESFGIKIPKTRALTRAEAFEVMWQAVSRPIMKNGKVLGEVTGRLQGETASFDIKAIRSDNLGFLVIEFNKPVDALSVNRNSIHLFAVATGKPIEISSVRVSGNKVFFIPTEKFARATVECTISGINSGWGESDKMKTVTRRFLIEDGAAPKCIGLEFTGEREITLLFDEPIASVGNVKLKHGNINIGVSETGVKGLGTDRIAFQVFANLQDGKVYEAKAERFKDLVGKANVETTIRETYTKRTSNPVLQIGEQTAEYVELIFSAPVKGVEESLFYHTDSEKRPIKITASPNFQSAPLSKNDYIDRAYLWFYDSSSDLNYPVPASETILYVDERGISDGFNETLKPGNYAIRSGEEIAKTRVQSVTFESSSKLKIVLSQKSARPVVRVVDEDGAELILRNIQSSSAVEFEYQFVRDMDTKEGLISVEISGDSSFVTHRVEIRYGDEEPPRVLNVVKKSSAEGRFLLVYFNEPLDDSALLLSNYQIILSNGVRNFSGRVSLSEDGKVVTISVPKSDYEEIVDKTTEMYISGIKDAAGNIMTSVKVRVGEQ